VTLRNLDPNQNIKRRFDKLVALLVRADRILCKGDGRRRSIKNVRKRRKRSIY
jgi:hypothetical protein